MSRIVPFSLVVMGIMSVAGVAAAAVKTETVEYRDGKVALKGFLAYPEGAAGPLPLVLVAPEWWGLTEYPKTRARQLAELGYVAFAVDMYGDGKATSDANQAAELAGKLKADANAMRRRVTAALNTMRGDKRVDGRHVAAIGYCFGGTAVLELARSGADIAGVVSFHGGLEPAKGGTTQRIRCKVLVCTGAEDKTVPMTQVSAFIDEMRGAQADFQVNSYANAVHSFTNPASGNDPSKNIAYNKEADQRSWQAMRDFLEEIFGKTKD